MPTSKRGVGRGGLLSYFFLSSFKPQFIRRQISYAGRTGTFGDPKRGFFSTLEEVGVCIGNGLLLYSTCGTHHRHEGGLVCYNQSGPRFRSPFCIFYLIYPAPPPLHGMDDDRLVLHHTQRTLHLGPDLVSDWLVPH